jgi:hypothetical protein
MAQRAQVTNHGESCGASTVPVAKRVMGKVKANTVTPTKPHTVPINRSCGVGSLLLMPAL